jgi:hypothetical protein
MGRILTETGALRALRRKGYLNCFAGPDKRAFVVSDAPLSREGSVVRYGVGRTLLLSRRLELVKGDSFVAAYRLKSTAKKKPEK